MIALQEIITNEMIGRIENELNKEVERLEADIRNRERLIYDDYSEIDTIVGEILKDYFQIPLIESGEIIDEIYPFVSEFDINIVPYVECNYSDSSQIAKGSVTHFFTISDLDSLTDNQYQDLQHLFDELVEVYDEMRIGMKVEFESVESNQQNEELLRVIEIYEGW